MCMIKSRFDNITADGTLLSSCFGCLSAGSMYGYVYLFTANRAFMPVVCFIFAPNRLVLMRDRSKHAANITVCITSMIICMGRQLCDCLGFSGIAVRAGIGPYAYILASGLFCHHAGIPYMICRFILTADGAGMLVLGIACFCPAIIAVCGDFCNNFGFRSAAAGTGVGFYTFFFAGRLLGNTAGIPNMIFAFFFGANRADALMSSVIHFNPRAVAVSVGLRYSFCFGSLTSGTGIGLDPILFASSGFGHLTGIPPMARRFLI